MFRIAKWIAPVVTLALLVCLSAQARAEDAKGTISGVVKGIDGNPAASVRIRVMKPEMKADKAEAKAEEGAKEKPKKEKPVAEATTDEQGKFSVEVPAGDYVVGAQLKGVGGAKEKVTVKAGETANVNLTLKAMKAKEPKKEIKN